MTLKKSYLALAVASATLVGCGGSSDSGSGDNGGTDVLSSCPNKPFIEAGNQVSGQDVCFIKGSVNEDFTLANDGTMWILDGFVTVGNGNYNIGSNTQAQAVKDAGVELEIEPGVVVRGTDDAVLVITRGSKIMADGTAAEPITFAPLDDAQWNIEGSWGGLIVQGFAPQYGGGNTGVCYTGSNTYCNVQGEGGTEVGVYGGNDPADNSGVIRYVRITGAGKVAGPNNEVNGLTLMGVGHETVLEYIQVHANLDDAVEWFGGTVNANHLVLTNNDDDDIDYDNGWKGNVQFAIIRKDPNKSGPTGSNDPRGIEANTGDSGYVPQTAGALANITIVGSDVNRVLNSNDSGNQPGVLLRGAVTTNMYNSVVINFRNCVRIQDANTGSGTAHSNVTLVNIVGDDCDGGFYNGSREADTIAGNVGLASDVTTGGQVMLTASGAVTNTSVGATATVNAWDPVDNGSGFAFETTTYAGAVAPGTAAADAWWAGWIIPGSLDGIENQRYVAPAPAVALP